MMRNWRAFRLPVKKRFAAAVLLFTATCLCQTPKAQPSAPVINLSAVLSWLPADTETIVGTNAFRLPDFSALTSDSQRSIPYTTELELRMRMLALGLLGFNNGGLENLLEGKTVVLAVEGSRNFRPPASLGEMRYEGCLIIVFGAAVKVNSSIFFRASTKSAKRLETVGGLRIAIFEETSENDTWSTFVGFPKENIVLVATDLDYLRTVLVRMHTAAGARALPENLPEWTYVDTHAPVWGIRHYRKVEPGLDPTSPFQDQAPANIPDSSAVGVTFRFFPSRHIAIVNYLSANASARQILQDHLQLVDAATASPREFQIRLSQPAEGVIEGSVPLSEQEAFYHVLAGLGAMLGHAVYF